jgi:hypothetical protein
MLIGAQKVGFLDREVRAHTNNVITLLTIRDTQALALFCQTCTQNRMSLQDYPLESLNGKNSVGYVKLSIRRWHISSQKLWCRYDRLWEMWLTAIGPRTDVGVQTVATSATISSAWPSSSPSLWSSRANSPIYGPLVRSIYEWNFCSTILGLG